MCDIQLEVGKSYKTRVGKVIHIDRSRTTFPYQFVSDEGLSFTSTGKYDVGHFSELDLIGEVIEVPVSAEKYVYSLTLTCQKGTSDMSTVESHLYESVPDINQVREILNEQGLAIMNATYDDLIKDGKVEYITGYCCILKKVLLK